jgi:hypothetical protein
MSRRKTIMTEKTDLSAKNTSIEYHPDAESELIELVQIYSRQIGGLAEQLATNDNSSEIQPGHILRASELIKWKLDEKARLKNGLRTISQIVGSTLIGVAVTGISLNMSLTFADGVSYLLSGVFGFALLGFGIFYRI